MKTKVILTIAVMLFATAGGAYATYIIDDFSSYVTPGSGDDATAIPNGWMMEPTAATGALTYTESGLASVLGGSRSTTVTSTSPTPGWTVAILDTGDPGSGLLVDNNLHTSNTISLLYDGSGAGLGLDLTDPMLTMFRTTMDIDHLGYGIPSVMSVTVNDGTNSSTVSQTWTPPGTPVQAVVNFDFLFNSFSPLIDFSHIESIRFDYSSDEGNDYAILTSISAVPEPATLLILGCMSGGMAVARKLRRKKA